MKRIAVVGTSGGVSFAAQGFDEALNAIGQNTGNTMFQYALWNRIRNPKLTVQIGSNPAAVRESADLLLFPAANQVNPAWDLGTWADFVEEVNLPCVVVGLGAQAPIDGNTELQLKPGTRRFLKSIADRTSDIGVRGQYTRAVLETLGIYNTRITGCPSQIINPRVTGLSVATQLAQLRTMERPRVAQSFGTFEEHTRPVERHLFDVLEELQPTLLFQTDPKILRFLFDGTLSSDAKKYFDWIGRYLRPDATSGWFEADVQHRGCFFSDARTWLDRMLRYDLVIGMRIHGAVAGIQAGTVGVCVAFDSRTLELAETMGYPYVRADDLINAKSLRHALDFIRFEPEDLDEARYRNGTAIDEILRDGGCIVD